MTDETKHPRSIIALCDPKYLYCPRCDASRLHEDRVRCEGGYYAICKTCHDWHQVAFFKARHTPRAAHEVGAA